MRTQTTRTIAGRVNANGSVAAGGSDFTVQKGATGAYVLTFPPMFRLIGVTITPTLNGYGTSSNGPPGANSTGVFLFVVTTSTGTDAPFMFIAVGVGA